MNALRICALISVILLTGSLLAEVDESPERPNIILCMTDDQGWGDTGYNGHPVLRTPHLDQMTKDGMRFERFYSGAPVCSPTRGSCITGRHPYRYGIRFANVGHMKKEEITLAEVLKMQGYSAGHFGKWHLGTLTTRIKESNRARPGNTKHYSPPWDSGFDACFSTEAKVPTWDPMKLPGDFGSGSKGLGWPFLTPGQKFTHYGTQYWEGEDKVAEGNLDGDDSRVIMDRALPFIRKAAEQRTPFLAVIWFHTPHLPVVAGPKYAAMYSEHDLHMRNFYGCITAMDEQMGRLRKELRNLGVEDNTMLWFCSDNGPEGNSNGPGKTNGLRGRKRSLYEGGVRVPGLLVWPKMIKKSRVVSMPCSTNDYFPTVLDALGHQLPEAKMRPYDGISLLPLIKGEMDQRSHPIAFESKNQVSLTDNQYKIYSKDKGQPYELYDLIADQGEEIDIADRQPHIVKRMRQTLEQWQQSCKKSANGKDYQ